MKKVMFIIAVIAVAYPISASAITGISLGVKAGSANYSGQVLPGSDDIGSALTYGAVVEISTLPMMDFEFQANYFKKDMTYSYDAGGTIGDVSQDFQFSDFSIVALAKKNLNPIPMSPVSLYLGGGFGWHVLSTEAAQAIAGNPLLANDPAGLAQNTGKLSAQGLLGLKVKFPVFPLAIFGEGSYGNIFADENVTTYSIEAGAMFSF